MRQVQVPAAALQQPRGRLDDLEQLMSAKSHTFIPVLHLRFPTRRDWSTTMTQRARQPGVIVLGSARGASPSP